MPSPTGCLLACISSLFLVRASLGSPAVTRGQTSQAETVQICQPEPLLWFHFLEAPAVLEAVEFPCAGWHLARPPVRWHGAQGPYDHSFFCDVFGVTTVAWLPVGASAGAVSADSSSMVVACCAAACLAGSAPCSTSACGCWMQSANCSNSRRDHPPSGPEPSIHARATMALFSSDN